MKWQRCARIALWVLAAATAPPGLAVAPSAPVLLPAAVVPESYDLTLRPDAARLEFSGTVSIAIQVLEPTRSITLNALELTIEQAALDGDQATPQITADEPRQMLSFDFGRTIARGRHTLVVRYHGRINRQPMGLFALDYAGDGGQQRALFTQFEAGDARRVLPCWDEPASKAVFTVTTLVPAAQLAVSNMPAAHAEEAGNGLQRVRFQATPKMSSYLLFLAIGDFQRLHRQVGNVDVGVVVKRGDLPFAGFVLDAAAELLPYYADYFGLAYPLPKLDLVAGPGTSTFFGAMENWGAIFSFEKVLLLDPRLSTESDRRQVYIVTAHELAHQWFGNLVTMNWWDDLWLNEGFASWMETKATDHFHPKWQVWSEALSATQVAMQLDAAMGTHPIITPIVDVVEANAAFDFITYFKGAAVVRMLESHAGAVTFRDGVRRYLRTHAYGNSVSDDLWRAIEGPDSRALTQIAHDFTLHEGVPLIDVHSLGCRDGNEVLVLSQHRFAVDESARGGAQRWRVPVVLRHLAADSAQPVTQVVIAGTRPQRHAITGCGPVLVNAGQTGYLRTRYFGDLQQSIIRNYATLAAVDQLGVWNDTGALAFGGLAPLTDLIALSAGLKADADPLVWDAVIDRMLVLDQLYDGLATQPAFRRYLRSLLAPVHARLGWEPIPGETDNVVMERATVLAALGRLGDPGVEAEARRRLTVYLQNPASLPAAQRSSVLHIIGLNANSADWDRLRALAASATSSLEKQQYYEQLASALDPALAQRALDLALTDEVPVTTRSLMMAIVGEAHPDLAVKFMSAHWEVIEPIVDTPTRPELVPNAGRNSNDTALIATLEAYAARFLPQTGRGALRRSIARVRQNAQIRSRLGEVDRWIAGQSSGAPGQLSAAPGQSARELR